MLATPDSAGAARAVGLTKEQLGVERTASGRVFPELPDGRLRPQPLPSLFPVPSRA
jgi:hypothetical protein